MVEIVKLNQFRFSYIIVIILILGICFLLGFKSFHDNVPNEVYQVYVDGKVIGMVKSRDSFDAFINKKESEVKRKYKVNKVHIPNGVILKKVTTYDNNISTNEEIYTNIVKIKEFTIKGCIITIKGKDGKDDIVIYTLKKSIFDEAVTNLIKSFVSEEEYTSYMESTQKEIVDVGSIIKDIDIDNEITYKNTNIGVDENIFTDSNELAKYLLYGTVEKQSTYIVNEGDTIEEVAFANHLNVQEFLLANSNFKSVNTLLYAGEEVNVGLINPLIDIKVEVNKVADEDRAFDVKVEYDPNELQGIEYVKQEGENGLYRVNREYEYINGQLSSTQTLSNFELKPSVDKVIVKGDKEVPHIADLSYWAWSTDTPYSITTYYGYRWGSMHAAIDISGPGFGTNIYAINNGTVDRVGSGCVPGNSGCNGRRGNYIIINHNNSNYYSIYMHMNTINVSQGQTVSRGQKIGTMGNTGEVYPVPSSYSPYSGTHLHLGTYRGHPDHGSPFDPLSLYR